MKKIFISILLFLFLEIFSGIFLSRSAMASLLTVNPEGKMIWQVLGDSTIQVKKIALDINPTPSSEISLNNNKGKIELSVTGRDGQVQNVDVTNVNENLVELLARPDSNDLKIGNVNGVFVIEENGISAQTLFPIKIDPKKNELSVETNSGLRLVSILPYEASSILVRAKLMDKIAANTIDLSENSHGELQYSVNGEKIINLFNVAKVNVSVKSKVSATTGEILNLEEPQWLKIFGFLFT